MQEVPHQPPEGLTAAQNMMFWMAAYKLSDALDVCASLGILAAVARSPLSSEQLASEAKVDAEALESVLELLRRARIVDRVEGGWLLPPDAAELLPFVRLEGEFRCRHASNQSLLRALQGEAGFDPMAGAEAPTRRLYFTAMASSARSVAVHLARAAQFPKAATIIDLGGADGAVALHLARLVPDARVTVVDRPASAPHFEERIVSAAAADAGRVRFVADDLARPRNIAALLRGVDAIVLSNLLHMLAPPAQTALLNLVKATGRAGSTLVVYDQFLRPHDHLSAESLHVIDWLNCGGRFDVTAEGFVSRLAGMRFREPRFQEFPKLPGAIITAIV